MPGVEALSYRKPLMFSAPVFFEIKPQKISLFPAIMVIENTWGTTDDTFIQRFHFNKMNSDFQLVGYPISDDDESDGGEEENLGFFAPARPDDGK